MLIKFNSLLRLSQIILTAGLLVVAVSACSGPSSSPNILEKIKMAIFLGTNSTFQLKGRSAALVFQDAKVAELANAACSSEATNEISVLVKSGVDVNGRGTEGITPLIWAMSCHNLAGIKALLKQGADPNLALTTDGSTAVYLAAGGSDPRILPLLLSHGGNPNAIRVLPENNPNAIYSQLDSALMNAGHLE